MTNKERYIEWSAAQEYMPIFMQPWWMDAVCAGKEWDVLLVESQESRVEGREMILSYHISLRIIFVCLAVASKNPQMVHGSGFRIQVFVSRVQFLYHLQQILPILIFRHRLG